MGTSVSDEVSVPNDASDATNKSHVTFTSATEGEPYEALPSKSQPSSKITNHNGISSQRIQAFMSSSYTSTSISARLAVDSRNFDQVASELMRQSRY